MPRSPADRVASLPAPPRPPAPPPSSPPPIPVHAFAHSEKKAHNTQTPRSAQSPAPSPNPARRSAAPPLSLPSRTSVNRFGCHAQHLHGDLFVTSSSRGRKRSD